MFDREQYLARVARMDRAGETEQLALPSGAVATVRRLGPEEWLNRAILPQALAMTAFRKFAAGQAEDGKLTDEHILALAQSRHDIIAAVLVEPRIVPAEIDPAAGELHYRDLGPEDAAAIFDWATRRREAARLEPFRHEPGDASGGDGGPAVRPAPERARRHRRSSNSS